MLSYYLKCNPLNLLSYNQYFGYNHIFPKQEKPFKETNASSFILITRDVFPDIRFGNSIPITPVQIWKFKALTDYVLFADVTRFFRTCFGFLAYFYRFQIWKRSSWSVVHDALSPRKFAVQIARICLAFYFVFCTRA